MQEINISTCFDEKELVEQAKKYIERYSKEVSKMIRGVPLDIERVIFNDPATIVLWNDGSKTVVKCMEGDTYSQEMGLAMCICKKALGDNYHKVFHEWVDYG